MNVNVNVICYDLNGVVTSSLRSISQKDYNSLKPLHPPMEEHDNIKDKNIRRESIELERSV